MSGTDIGYHGYSLNELQLVKRMESFLSYFLYRFDQRREGNGRRQSQHLSIIHNGRRSSVLGILGQRGLQRLDAVLLRQQLDEVLHKIVRRRPVQSPTQRHEHVLLHLDQVLLGVQPATDPLAHEIQFDVHPASRLECQHERGDECQLELVSGRHGVLGAGMAGGEEAVEVGEGHGSDGRVEGAGGENGVGPLAELVAV